MKVATVFLDTAALLALAHRRDGLHDQAMRIQQELTAARTPLITSDWVLTEFLGGAAKPELRGAAVAAIERIRASPRARIVEATREQWLRAYEFFRQRSDKEWSLVDCSSMLLCHDHAITRVFTSDHHFAQAGYEVLLKQG
jgi:predicted nucleic acid-binding protein